MRRGKSVRWHVDQLTEQGLVIGSWIFPGGDECRLVQICSHICQRQLPGSAFGWFIGDLDAVIAPPCRNFGSLAMLAARSAAPRRGSRQWHTRGRKLEAPSAGQNTPGAPGQHRGRRGIRGHCLNHTRTSAAWCWYLKPELRLTERGRSPSFLRPFLQHARPLPDSQSDPRPVFDCSFEDAPCFVEIVASIK